MQIEGNEDSTISFSALMTGDVFEMERIVYMKISEIEDVVAIRVNDGTAMKIRPEIRVIHHSKAVLVLKGNK